MPQSDKIYKFKNSGESIYIHSANWFCSICVSFILKSCYIFVHMFYVFTHGAIRNIRLPCKTKLPHESWQGVDTSFPIPKETKYPTKSRQRFCEFCQFFSFFFVFFIFWLGKSNVANQGSSHSLRLAPGGFRGVSVRLIAFQSVPEGF